MIHFSNNRHALCGLNNSYDYRRKKYKIEVVVTHKKITCPDCLGMWIERQEAKLEEARNLLNEYDPSWKDKRKPSTEERLKELESVVWELKKQFLEVNFTQVPVIH